MTTSPDSNTPPAAPAVRPPKYKMPDLTLDLSAAQGFGSAIEDIMAKLGANLEVSAPDAGKVQIDIQNESSKGPANVELSKEDRKSMTEDLIRLKSSIQTSLRTGLWDVEYFKVDGSEAIMACTLDPRLLPLPTPRAISEIRKQPVHTLQVYCPDVTGWRSFVVANVTKITPLS